MFGIMRRRKKKRVIEPPIERKYLHCTACAHDYIGTVLQACPCCQVRFRAIVREANQNERAATLLICT